MKKYFIMIVLAIMLLSATGAVVTGEDMHGYDSCEISPESTKCCCFVKEHIHDLGKKFPLNSVLKVEYEAGTPGGHCDRSYGYIYVSTNKSNWSLIEKIDIPERSQGDSLHTKNYVISTTEFRYVKVYIPDCYNDYSSAEAWYEEPKVHPPTLIYPANNSNSDDTTPDLTWEYIVDENINYFQILIADNLEFNNPIIDKIVYDSTYTPDPELSYKTYYWRVKSHSTNDIWSEWSDAWAITLSETGCSHEELDAQYETGKQYCIDNPKFCGLYNQKDVDDSYNQGHDDGYAEGYGAVQENCGNTEQPFTGELPESIQTYLILTDNSVPFYFPPGSYFQGYGSKSGNTVNVRRYARVELKNFIGENQINIEEASSQFTVYRSGATVYLNSSFGTLIKIAATSTSQILRFADGSSELIVRDGLVMIGNQVVEGIRNLLDIPINGNDTSKDIF